MNPCYLIVHRVLACVNFFSRIPIGHERYQPAVFGRLIKALKS